MSQVFKYNRIRDGKTFPDGKPYMTKGAVKSALKTGNFWTTKGDTIEIVTYELVPVKTEKFKIGENNQLIPL